MEAIRVSHLVKKYKDFTAVNDISFSVGEGELFAFLGENGAGKSTTINILCTILERTGGDITVCGHKLGSEDDNIRSKIGIVFQNSVLDAKLTVRENLYTRGSYYGLSKKQIEERLTPLSAGFELDRLWEKKYGSLSGGERRRVDIIRALINEPEILFLDEPTTGLDPKSRKLVWDYIGFLRENRGMTIFLTTHYMEETRDADNVVILDRGTIVASGTPAELKSRYAAGRFVWYTEESPEKEALMKELASLHGAVRSSENAASFSRDADHYNVPIRENIADFLYRYREQITDYEIIKGSMDDVFLNLTGKELQQ